MDKNYGGVIWTKHALSRMMERGIKQGDAWVTWRRPDQSRYAKKKGAWVYYRVFENQRVEVVAKNPSTGSGQGGEWVIISVWSRKIRIPKRPSNKKSSFLKSILGFIDRNR